ncbi:MAG: hypothetical protein ACRC2S_26200 [Waterburya sp.]
MELILAASAGALAGYVVANTIGGVGVAVAGTALGMKTTEIVITGAVIGIAVYGLSKAICC